MAKKKIVKKQGIHLYKSKRLTNPVAPKWYWILVSKNGRTIARSSEMYSSKQAAVKSILAVAIFFDQNSHYFDHTQKDTALVAF